MNGAAELAKGWFSKADSELAAARTVLAGRGPYDTACFHCQQAVEKYMKGFLALRGTPFPFTHDLDVLAKLCQDAHPALRLRTPDVVALTDYAVELRYDHEFWPSQAEVSTALAVAERVRAEIKALVPSPLRP